MDYTDTILGANESSPEFLAVGYCDICVQELTSGSVKLQYLLPKTPVLTNPTWKDFPGGLFSYDLFQTIFVSQHGVMIRFTGVSNNAGVYIKMAKHLNEG